MTRNKTVEPDVSHVFDQTNGVVDLGANEPSRPNSGVEKPGSDRDLTLDGLAAISIKTH